MRSHYAAAVRRGVLFLAAGLPAFAPIGSLHAQGDSAAVASATPSADAASESGATPPENAISPPSDQPAETYTSEPVESGVQGLNFANGVPPDAFGDQQEQPFGVPYSKVFVRQGADDNLFDNLNRDPFPTGVYSPAKIGEVEGSLGAGGVDLPAYIPFFHAGAEPENADIKAGPLYIKFHYLNAIVLYDDNFNRTETDRKAATLVLLNLNLSIIAQLSEGLQFTVSGSLGYLPLQNQFGVEPSTYNSLGLLLYAVPFFAAQLAYQTDIAGWPVVFADSFRAGAGTYSDNLGNDFTLFKGNDLERDEEGNYTFHSAPTLRGDQNTTINSDVGYYSNTVSAATQQMLPEDIRLSASISHEDLWYNQEERGLPPGRDDLYVSLISERENLRFKPILSYQATYVEDQPGIVQSIRGGIFGPIDDQLFLEATGGVYIDAFGHDGFLYHLSLRHDAGPYTSQEVSVDSYLSSFNQEQITSEYYRLLQILGPTLSAAIILGHYTYDELTRDGTADHSDYLGGAELTWDLGPKTTLELAGIFDQQRYTDGERRDTTTGRVILNRLITDDLTFQLLYEYQHSTANRHNDTYLQNIVYISIVKYLQ
jgi:hypothetical protein